MRWRAHQINLYLDAISCCFAQRQVPEIMI